MNFKEKFLSDICADVLKKEGIAEKASKIFIKKIKRGSRMVIFEPF